MIKRIQYDLDPKDHQIELIDFDAPLTKTASISSEMQETIENIKPDTGKSYIVVNALGAGEYWGSNKNADYFPEKSLELYHKTFESAGVYKHHQNKDPQKSLGKVCYAHYNPDMHRVELLLEVHKNRAPEIIQRIEGNEKIAVSMGCKVPWDRCTICYKKASKADEYCEHIKTAKNKIFADGRKVAMVNEMPRFFDISFVTIPADRGGYMMKKVAYTQPEAELSAKLGEEWLREAQLKESDIDKKLDSNIAEEAIVLEQRKGRLQVPKSLPGDLPKDWLDDTVSKTGASELLTAMAATQIMPTPKDFQYILLKNYNEKLAEELYTSDVIFELNQKQFNPPSDWDMNNLSKTALDQCLKVIPTHSLTVPNIVARNLVKFADTAEITKVPLETTGAAKLPNRIPVDLIGQNETPRPTIKNPLFTLGVISGLYYAFSKFFKGVGIGNPSALEKAVQSHPALLPLLVGGTAWGAVKTQEMLVPPQPQIGKYQKSGDAYSFVKQAGTPGYWLERALITIPGTYVYSGFQETKRQQGIPLNSAQEFVRKHPLMSSVGAFAVSEPLMRRAQKALGKYATLSSELFFKLDQHEFEDFYKDLTKIV